MAILATLQKILIFDQEDILLILLKFECEILWIISFEKKLISCPTSPAQPNYTPERDTHFPYYTENLQFHGK